MKTIPSAFIKTPPEVAAEVLMTRAAFHGVILLVEGPSDSKFFQRHTVSSNTQIAICGGKNTVLGAMALLSTHTLSGLCAVIDRDYEGYRGTTPGPSIFWTDAHDLETQMLSGRLMTVVDELGDVWKIEAFQMVNGNIEQALLAKCEIFSRLRYMNELAPAFCLDFKSFTPWKYIALDTWAVDEVRLLNDFRACCPCSHSEFEQHLTAVPQLASWAGAHGHDALAILSIGIRRVLEPIS